MANTYSNLSPYANSALPLASLREYLKRALRICWPQSSWYGWKDNKSKWRRLHAISRPLQDEMYKISGGVWPVYAYYRDTQKLLENQYFLWGDLKIEELSRQVKKKRKRTYTISFSVWRPPYTPEIVTKIEFVFDPEIDILQSGEQLSFSFIT
jgi:hypothetical protein